MSIDFHAILSRMVRLFSPRARRQHWEERVLAALHAGQELSGYQLREAAGMSSVASFYVLTERLETAGEITSRWGVATPERGGRRPRLYRIAG